MLQIAPDTSVDAKPFDGDEDALLCAQCSTFVTRRAWEETVNNRTEHYCVNPLGIEFRVVSFSQAPGAKAMGPARTEASWFSGYAWRLAVCTSCGTHLGWRYEQVGGGGLFFGLIRDALIEKAGDG